MLVGGCGTTVKRSLKVVPPTKVNVGDNRAVVVLPFADYSYADDLKHHFVEICLSMNIASSIISFVWVSTFNQEMFFIFLLNREY